MDSPLIITAAEFLRRFKDIGDELSNLIVQGVVKIENDFEFKSRLTAVYNCSFETIIWHNDRIEKQVFLSCYFFGGIFIHRSVKKTFDFDKCSINKFHLNERCELDKLKLSACSRIGVLDFAATACRKIVIVDSNLIRLKYKSKCNANIEIVNSFEPSSILLEGILNEIKITQCSGSIKLNNVDCNVIKIFESNEFSASFSDVKSGTIDISGGKLNDLEFIGMGDFYLRAGGNDGSSNVTEVDKLILSNFVTREKARLHFVKLNVNKVNLNHFDNHGYFELSNSLVRDELSVISAKLRIGNLNNTTIAKKAKFLLLDSDVSKIEFSSFRWHSSYKIEENIEAYPSQLSTDFFKNISESYRQLKVGYQSVGNKIDALEFHRNELRIHHKMLTQSKFNDLKSFGNYLIIASNKCFSDFGQNIWLPLFYLFVVHFILYNCMIFYFDLGFKWDFQNFSIQASLKAVDLYFYTLLPTHNFNLLDVFVGGWIDFLMRICSGYFIFYFIYTSRKYHN